MDSDKRKRELLDAFKDIDESKNTLVSQIIDEIVFLEGQLIGLKQYPFIQVNPKNPAMQKQTEASKQYVKLSQSYLQSVKVLSSCLGKNTLEEDDNPLNKWIKANLQGVGDG